MSGGFFRGTSADQDTRFSNKQAKLMKTQKFPPELEHPVVMSKVKMDVMKPWIANRVTELIGFEDEVLINFIYGLLEKKVVNGKEVQISLTGFMERNTGKFMKELWSLLLSAQQNASGVPQQFLDAKEEETRKRKVETDRIANEIQRQKEKEKREKEQETNKKMDGDIGNGRDAKGSLEHSRRQYRASSRRSADEKDIDERSGSRGRSRGHRSPSSANPSPSPRHRRSRSLSKSFSSSRSYSNERPRSKSISRSPRTRGPSISSEKMNRSPPRRSVSPRRRRSPRRYASPPRHRSSHYRRRSMSPFRYRSPSPARYRKQSPLRRRSRSPMRRRSRSPMRRRSRSPIRNRSSSPSRSRSESPVRRSESPVRHRSPSVRRRSRSPIRRRSRSPIRRRSPVSSRRRSPSPIKRRYRRSPSTPIRRRSPAPIRRRSPAPIRRRSPSPIRRRSPSPIRRRSPPRHRYQSTPRRSVSPVGQRSRSPQDSNGRRSHSPVRRRSPEAKRGSPARSTGDRIRRPEKYSPASFSSPRKDGERPGSSQKESNSSGRQPHLSLMSPQRDSPRIGSRKEALASPTSPRRSLSISESSPVARRRSPVEERSRGSYEISMNLKKEKILRSESLSPPPKQGQKMTPHDNSDTGRNGMETRTRDAQDRKYRSLKEVSPVPNKLRGSFARVHREDEPSPKRLAGHHSELRGRSDGVESRENSQVMKSERSGRVDRHEVSDQRELPVTRKSSSSSKREKESYDVDGFRADEKSHSMKGQHYEAKSSPKTSRKVEQHDRSGLVDSVSEESDKHGAKVKDTRKHKRSEREDIESEEDSSSDSHIEDRKEAKRRRKEEKKLKKEERRRRREERRRRREDRRAEKRRRKSIGASTPPSNSVRNHDGLSSDDEYVKKTDKHASDMEQTESDQKKLEIALREKALESLRAKKGIGR